MKHKIQWTIKHFEELTALEYHHILALRISIFIVEQDCPYQDADHKDLQSYHVYGTIDDKVAAVVRIVSPGISYPEIAIGRVAVAKDRKSTRLNSSHDQISYAVFCLKKKRKKKKKKTKT